MNRRNFFKVVTGFVAGIFATSVEGKKKTELRDFDECDLTIGERYCYEECSHFDVCLAELKRREQFQLWRLPAYIIHEDGNIEPIPYQEFYKTV